MAQLTELLRMLQPLDGRDEQTLYNSARKLREEGLLPKGKRGSGAPELSYEDAANVLLGVVGSTRSVDAADRCRLLSSLKTLGTDRSAEEFAPQDRLGSTVAELLRDFPGSLNFIANEISRGEKLKSKPAVLKRVAACIVNRGPVAMNLLLRSRSARLEVMAYDGTLLMFADYVSDPKDKQHMAAYKRRARDREVVIQIGLMTLMATSYAIASDLDRKLMDKMLGVPIMELLYGKED